VLAGGTADGGLGQNIHKAQVLYKADPGVWGSTSMLCIEGLGI
jgi:hypothetical protein